MSYSNQLFSRFGRIVGAVAAVALLAGAGNSGIGAGGKSAGRPSPFPSRLSSWFRVADSSGRDFIAAGTATALGRATAITAGPIRPTAMSGTTTRNTIIPLM